jgi:hypothetical protein
MTAPHQTGAPGSFLSPPRQKYLESYREWHRKTLDSGDLPRVGFMLLRRPFPVPEILLPQPEDQENFVTASLASIPERRETLEQVTASLLPQVDRLNVYLNNYPEVPSFLDHEKIRVIRSQDEGDIRDNGKFYFLDAAPRGYYFAVDDDIAYPPDYVQELILKLDQYDHRLIAGVHGVVFPNPIERFYKDRTVFSFKHARERDTFVNLLGTATVAFHTDTLELSLADFKAPGMADLWLALAAKRQKIPMISIQREQGWMKDIEPGDAALYREFMKSDDLQTRVIKEAGAWDFAGNADIYSPIAESLLASFTSAELQSRGVDLAFLEDMRHLGRPTAG